MLSWDVGKINPQKLPSLKGTMSLQAGASKPDENPTINIQFKIQQMAISGTHTHAQNTWTSWRGTLRPLDGAKDTRIYLLMVDIGSFYFIFAAKFQSDMTDNIVSLCCPEK